MPAETYELISQGLRYWFAFLGVAIVIRSYRWAMQDHRRLKRVLKALPDSGLIGEVVNLATGESQPLPREGMMGSSKSCDISFSGIRKFELEFAYVDGLGVYIIPRHTHHQILLQNKPLNKKSYALHGSRLNLPGYSLRFRLFAGLNIPEQEYNEDIQNNISAYQDNFDIESLGNTGMPIDFFENTVNSNEPTLHPEIAMQLEYQECTPNIKSEQVMSWDPQLTWQYAPPPAEEYNTGSDETYYHSGQPVWEQNNYDIRQPVIHVRRKRSKRHER